MRDSKCLTPTEERFLSHGSEPAAVADPVVPRPRRALGSARCRRRRWAQPGYSQHSHLFSWLDRRCFRMRLLEITPWLERSGGEGTSGLCGAGGTAKSSFVVAGGIALLSPGPALLLRGARLLPCGAQVNSSSASRRCFPGTCLGLLFVYLGFFFFLFLQVIHLLHHFSPGEGQKGLIFVRFVKIFLCL